LAPRAHSHSFFLHPVSFDDVRGYISQFPTGKCPGHDGLNAQTIKTSVDTIVEPLTYIINLSFNSGIFPDSLKIAKVIPIYKKKGSPFEPTNYRPISILSSLSKIFERAIYVQLNKYITSNHILYSKQYGFRKKKSTKSAIIDVCNQLLQNFDNNTITIGLFLDISKAFDSVQTHILIDKLEHYGIRGPPLALISSYLSCRKQYVCIHDSKSILKEIYQGVPQGSILGPLLFLIYINDMPTCLSTGEIYLYADDATIFTSGINISRIATNINMDLMSLNDWLTG